MAFSLYPESKKDYKIYTLNTVKSVEYAILCPFT